MGHKQDCHAVRGVAGFGPKPNSGTLKNVKPYPRPASRSISMLKWRSSSTAVLPVGPEPAFEVPEGLVTGADGRLIAARMGGVRLGGCRDTDLGAVTLAGGKT